MRRITLPSNAAVSCFVAHVLFGLSPPCDYCSDMEEITLSDGAGVTVKLLPGGVLEIDGADDVVDALKQRRCGYVK